jgi:hypothetical protein
MKKEAFPKNIKGLIKKTSNEKRGILKNTKGLIKKTFDKRRGISKKCEWTH